MSQFVWMLVLFCCFIRNEAMKTRFGKYHDIDYDKLDKEWNDDDDSSDSSEEDFPSLKKPNNIKLPKDGDKISPEEYNELKDMPGELPEMYFISLRTEKGWTQEDTKELASKWKYQVSMGGAGADFYDLNTTRILANLKNRLETENFRQYLIDQPEVEEIEVDQKLIYQRKTDQAQASSNIKSASSDDNKDTKQETNPQAKSETKLSEEL